MLVYRGKLKISVNNTKGYFYGDVEDEEHNEVYPYFTDKEYIVSRFKEKEIIQDVIDIYKKGL